ncbi:MAG: hypothetical protein QM760_22840 [Nibricoccus sp.]
MERDIGIVGSDLNRRALSPTFRFLEMTTRNRRTETEFCRRVSPSSLPAGEIVTADALNS